MRPHWPRTLCCVSDMSGSGSGVCDLLHIADITPAKATKHGFILPLQRIYIRNVSPFSLFVQVSSTRPRISGFYFAPSAPASCCYFPPSTGITMWCGTETWAEKIDSRENFIDSDDLMTHEYLGHEWPRVYMWVCLYMNNVCHCVGCGAWSRLCLVLEPHSWQSQHHNCRRQT